jgi:thioredoxin reductase
MADYDVAIIGSGLGGLTEVRALNVATGQESQIDLKGVFVYVGLEPNTAFSEASYS